MASTLLQQELVHIDLVIAKKKAEYKNGIRSGKIFSEVKEIYLEIKELEEKKDGCIKKEKQLGKIVYST